MGAFDDRENAFEQRAASNEELRFKIDARRNKTLATWLAGLLGYDAEASKRYAESFVAENVTVNDDETLFVVLRNGLMRGNVELSDNRIRQKMIEARNQAREEFKPKA